MATLRVRLGAMALLFAGLLASPALAQLCMIDPISPLCCPSPCPVFDPTRVPKLLGDVEALGNAVRIDAQIVQSASEIKQSIGEARAAATTIIQQYSSLAGTLSGEVTAIQSGLSANPAEALNGIKQTLFEPANAALPNATQLTNRQSARVAAGQGEQVASLAVSLMRTQALSTNSAQRSQLSSAMSNSQQLQGDLAVNSTSRLAIYQDVGALHQLVSAWVAQRSMQSAAVHTIGDGGTTATTASTLATPASANSPPPQNVTSALDQLVALHDARVAAQAVLATYPALQQAVSSARLASQFASDAESSLRQSLSDIGLASSTSLSTIETALKTADSTDWLDSAKSVSALQAVSKVVAGLTNGTVGQATSDSLRAAMLGWLDADKQSRYWTDQAAQAQQSMSALDAHLGTLSDLAGVDVTGTSGRLREEALIASLSRDPAAARWRPLLTIAAKDASAQSVLGYSVAP